jgi:protein TonB
MFDHLVESSPIKKKSNRWAYFLVTATLWITLLTGVIIWGIMAFDAKLNEQFNALTLLAPPPPPPPAEVKVEVVRPVARLLTQGRLMQPRAIPKQVVVFREAELPPEAPPSMGVFGGVESLLGGLGEGSTGAAPPPPPIRVTRTRVGGQVQEARIIAKPTPIYPPLARQARIQGRVVLHAIIDKEGRVSELESVSGHPLLIRAALDAVQNWRYQPTILNGEPVEVDTTIDVNFVLGG